MIPPRKLAKIRDQLIRHLSDPSMPVRAYTGPENQEWLDLALGHLKAAELWWVTQDMTALAVHAGGSLEAARWATADRPSGCGLLYWDGGISTLDAYGFEIPVDACTWGPAPAAPHLGP